MYSTYELFDSKHTKQKMLCIIQRTIIFLFAFFTTLSINCQSTNNNQKTTEIDYKYDSNIKLNINEKIQFEDGLSIILTSFTHKHPYVDGPTKATAYIMISKNKITEEKSLSIHGVEGKSEVHYDSLLWDEYEFHLKAFDYDKSIEIIITKRK